ncbi:MAG: adenylosuccinate synthase [Candidatus Riflebacteria bacterium]|nr:adenylosuccinate synthase [Candidatus Riflebacteria bacterium]
MPCTIVLGAQWGDEGKGKIVNILASDMDAVARFQGGANAGHTLVLDGKKIVLHQIPSGIFNANCVNFITGGCVVDPEALVEEIEMLDNFGETVDPRRLKIAENAHIVTRMHKWIDSIEGGKVGTTGRGIGPCYVSKARRTGIRFKNILDGSYKTLFEGMFSECVKHYGLESRNYSDFFEPFEDAIHKVAQFACDTRYILFKSIAEEKNILFEGAQGAMLDIDNGSYPYVTSSNTSIGGALTGAGVFIDFMERIGVMKAYCTRVGNGPFPTELKDETGEKLRQIGNEFGATTGRPRRCGWLDLKLLKESCMLNGFTSLALTKMDCMSGFEKIKAGVGSDSSEHPIFKEFDGWTEDISLLTSYNELPSACRQFISYIEDFLGIPFKLISLGPDRNQTLNMEQKI